MRLTEQENKIVMLLDDIWRQYTTLPAQHPQDEIGFAQAIHEAQRIVIARPIQRYLNEEQQ